MKIIPKISIIICAIILSACDGIPNPGAWGLIQPENAYEIDAWGSNPDLLEFTPKGNSQYFCILAISGSDKLTTMFCMPKPVSD